LFLTRDKLRFVANQVVVSYRSETMNVMMLRALTWATVAAAVISALLLAWVE
jgi:hypothetical protein